MVEHKYLSYNQKNANCYFWRTYSGTEIDYVEEIGADFFAYEIKFNKAKARMPASWSDEYGSNFQVINKGNYLEFIL